MQPFSCRHSLADAKSILASQCKRPADTMNKSKNNNHHFYCLCESFMATTSRTPTSTTMTTTKTKTTLHDDDENKDGNKQRQWHTRLCITTIFVLCSQHLLAEAYRLAPYSIQIRHTNHQKCSPIQFLFPLLHSTSMSEPHQSTEAC